MRGPETGSSVAYRANFTLASRIFSKRPTSPPNWETIGKETMQLNDISFIFGALLFLAILYYFAGAWRTNRTEWEINHRIVHEITRAADAEREPVIPYHQKWRVRSCIATCTETGEIVTTYRLSDEAINAALNRS